MDLELAFQKHGRWIEEFCTAIFDRDSLNAETYGKDNCCELGKWLYGEGQTQYGKYNAFSELVSRHAAFHKVAEKVALAINAKDYILAEYLLGEVGEYAAASHEVHKAIAKLKLECY
jgi:methyl-accepting chemotaxis protein